MRWAVVFFLIYLVITQVVAQTDEANVNRGQQTNESVNLQSNKELVDRERLELKLREDYLAVKAEHLKTKEELLTTKFKELDAQFKIGLTNRVFFLVSVVIAVLGLLTFLGIHSWFKRSIITQVEEETRKKVETEVEKNINGFRQSIEESKKLIVEVDEIRNQIAEQHEKLAHSILAGAIITQETSKGLDLPIVQRIFTTEKLGSTVKRNAIRVFGWHGEKCGEDIVNELIETLKLTKPEIGDSNDLKDDKRGLSQVVIEALERIGTQSVYSGLIDYLRFLLESTKQRLSHHQEYVQRQARHTPQWAQVAEIFELSRAYQVLPMFNDALSVIIDFKFEDTETGCEIIFDSVGENQRSGYLVRTTQGLEQAGVNNEEAAKTFTIIVEKVADISTKLNYIDELKKIGTDSARVQVQSLTDKITTDLLEKLQHREENTRENALKFLLTFYLKGYILDARIKEVVNASREVIRDGCNGILRHGSRLLIHMNYKEEAVPALVELLKSDNKQVGENAAKELKKINTPEAVTAIQEWVPKN